MEQRKTINISKEMHNFLNKRGKRGDTYEQIIWRLILTQTHDEETKKAIKEAQKNYQELL